MEEVIGIRGQGCGSLRDFGVTYSQVELLPDGTPDLEGIRQAGGTLRRSAPQRLQTAPSAGDQIGRYRSFWKLLSLCFCCLPRMCKYLCPLGAFYGLFNRISFYQMNLEPASCTGCKSCERVCPMNVRITQTINSPECIRCGKCRSVCPTEAISSGFVKKCRSLEQSDTK